MAFSRKFLGHGVGLRTKHFASYLAAPPEPRSAALYGSTVSPFMR